MDIIKVKPDVLACKSDICLFDSGAINFLKLIAKHSKKKEREFVHTILMTICYTKCLSYYTKSLTYDHISILAKLNLFM